MRIEKRTYISLLLLGAFAVIGPGRQGLAQAPQPALEITAPATGTVVVPGQTLSVTVASSGGTFSQVGLVAEYPIGFSNLLTAPPFQYSITVPANAAVGTYHLTAVGATGQSSLIESQPVTIYVERSEAPVAISVQPSTIVFEAQGQQVPLQVLGTFSDGTVQDLTGSSQLAFSSSNSAVATVSPRGVVSAVGSGSSPMLVSYARAAAAGVQVSVSGLTTTASPSTLNFSNTTVGASTAAQAVVVTNAGSASVTFASVTATGDFKEMDNCSGQTIGPGGTCTVNVTYSPTLIGQEGGQLTVTNGFDVVPLTVPLSGIGVSATSATLIATLTDSGNLTLGQSGATYSLSVQNIGNGPLSGVITVTETLPSAFTLTALSGTGWNCSLTLAQCTRSDGLASGGSYPSITASGDLSSTAPQTVLTSAMVSYVAGSGTVSYTATDSELVAPLMQVIAFGPLNNLTIGAVPFNITASASSGLAVIFTSMTPAVCSVSGSTVTLVAIGVCSITASQPGNMNIPAAASVTQSFTVSKVWQVIVFLPLNDVSLTMPPFVVSATASSHLAVSFTSTTTAVCSVSNRIVTILGLGTCSITASQAGNSTIGAATPVTQSFNVSAPAAKTTATVTVVPSLSSITTAQTLTVTITVNGGSGNPTPTGSVTLTSGGYSTGGTTLSHGSATIGMPTGSLQVGTDTLTASYSGDGSYLASVGTASVTVSNSIPANVTPTVTVMPSASSITTAQSLIISVVVSGGTGNPVPTGSVTLTSGSYTAAAAILTSGSATINVPAGSLSVGNDTLTVTYTPDAASSSVYNSATGTDPALAVTQSTTMLTVTVTPNSAAFGSLFTLSAMVKDQNGAPLTKGSVTFYNGGTALGTVQVIGTASAGATIGSATLKTILMSLGSNTVTAKYAMGNSSNISQPAVVTVTGQYPTTTTFAATGSADNYTFTGKVLGKGPVAPYGSIVFTDSTTGLVPGTVAFSPTDLAQTFVNAPTIAGFSSPQTVRLADVNGDGIPDLIVGSNNGLTIQIGNGDGTFRAPNPILSGEVPSGGIAFGDFNADGNLDIAAASGGSIVVLLGNGDGTFQPQASYDSGSPGATLAGDFNGDGILDIVAIGSGTVDLLLGNGDGTFKQPVKYTVNYPLSLVAGDVNGDGILDVVVGSNPNNVSILLGSTDGTLHAGQTYITQYGPGGLLLGDFRGVGKLDLVTVFNQCCEDDNTAANILLGNGDGTFGPQQTFLTGADFSGLAEGDFDGDGKLDLVVSVYGYPYLAVLLGYGDGTFQNPVLYSVGTGPVQPAVADLNQDGRPDIVVANYNDGTATILLDQVTQTATLNNVILPGSGTHSVAGAYSGDASHSSGSSNMLQLVASLVAPVMQLTGLPSTTVSLGQALNVNVNLVGPLSFIPPPSGNVSYSVDGGAAQLAKLAGGSVTIPLNQLSAGFHAIFVSYGGDQYYANLAQQTLPLTVVRKTTPTVTVTPSALSVTTAAALTVTVSVNGASGNPFPTGTVTLSGGGYNSAITTLNSGNSTVIVPAGSLAAGIDLLTGSYTPDSYSALAYGSANGSAYVAVTTPGKLTPTVTVTPSSTSITAAQTLSVTVTLGGGTGNPTPSGSLTLIGGGYVSAATLLSNGSGTISIPAGSLATGIDTLAIAYTPDTSSSSIYNSAIATTSVAVVAATGEPIPTATTLVMSSGFGDVTTVVSGSVIMLTATVKAGDTPVTLGQVNFCDASSKFCTDIHLLGTSQLTSSGTAELRIVPGIGVRSYKAVFVGTNTDASSSSSVLALSVSGEFPTTTTLLQSGSAGNSTLTVGVAAGAGGTTAPTGTVYLLDTSNEDELLGTAALGGGWSTLNWTNPQAPSTGGNAPSAVVVGDFNGDGIPDLAAPNGSGVVVFLGNGDGTFAAASVTPTTGYCPSAIAVGDFNGDGKADLAVTDCGSLTVTILLGNGDGTFTAAAASPATGGGPESIVVGDFNGDGRADLAIANYDSDTVTVLLGNGDGTFTAGASPATGAGPESIAVGDFNQDGKTDLAVANYYSESVTILLSNGDGTFTGQPASPATGGTPISVVVGDFNGDGKADLSVVNKTYDSGGCPGCGTFDGTVRILLGNGDGTFAVGATPPVRGQYFESEAVGDFNGDGIPDLAIAGDGGAIGGVIVLLGNGDGTFVAATNPLPGSGAEQIAVGDFNGDGKADVAVTMGDPSVTVLLAQWSQTSTATLTGISPVGPGPHLVEASYPGDNTYLSSVSGTTVVYTRPPPTTTTLAVTVSGSPVTSVSPGTVVTLIATVNAGTASVKSGQVNFCDATAAFCTDIHLVGAAQLTSSGLAMLKFIPGIGNHSYKAIFVGGNTSDAASSSAASNLTVTGKYLTASTIAEQGYAGTFTLTATVNGYVSDGAVLSPTGTVSFLDASDGNSVLGTAVLGSGGLGLGWINSQTAATGNTPLSMATGDFNSDGVPDLVAINYCGSDTTCGSPGTVTILLGNGDGTFTATPTSPTTGKQPQALVVGDFNGDGKQDLAVANSSDNSVTILLGNGDGTFSAAAVSPVTGNQPISIAVGDFNGDGKQDLAVANNGDNSVTILLGNGDGTFRSVVSPLMNSAPFAVVVADFNGDGFPDLAVARGGTSLFGPGIVTILLGNGDGTFTEGASPFAGDDPESIAVGDFDGDGIPDLAVANTEPPVASINNFMTVLLGNGDGTFRTTSVPLGWVSLWSVQAGDFNGDGIPDLVAGNTSFGNPIILLLGNGDGTFNTSSAVPGVTGSDFTGIAVGDFNGDGVVDFVAADSIQNTAAVLLTQLTQTATATLSGVSPVGSGAHKVDASYPGDGNYDSSLSGSITLFVPSATSTTLAVTASDAPVTAVSAGSVVTLTAKVQAGSTSVTTGQVNFCDATAAYCTDIHIVGTAQLTNAGTAQVKFVPERGNHSYKAVFVATDTYTSSSSSASNLAVTGKTPSATAIAQSGTAGNYTLTATVTSTGATTVPTGTVSFLDTSNGSSLLGTAALESGMSGLGWLTSQTLTTVANPYNFAEGDFNGDGIADLAVINLGTNTLAILLGNGNGTFTPTASPGTGSGSSCVAAGDFNGDGKTDLAIANDGNYQENGSVTILLGNGDGTFAAAAANLPTGISPGCPVTGDFNGDGKIDLAVATTIGITVFLGNGDGTFTAAPSSPTNTGVIAVADFNGDGIADLAVMSNNNSGLSGNLTILLGHGDGTFTATTSSTTTAYLSSSMAIGDFNGDGKADLAIVSTAGYPLTILLGNGDGTFAAAASPDNSTDSQAVAIGDFNDDGKVDLAVSRGYANSVTILLGNGDGTFTQTAVSPQAGSIPSGNQSLVVGDFNGDGISDLAVGSDSTSTVTVLLTATQTATATATGISPVGTGTHQVDASYSGDNSYNLSISGTTGLSAQQLLPVIQLTASTASATAGTPVTFTATVNSAVPPAPTGTVTFQSGAATLGTSSMNSSGVATYLTSTLAPGQDSITAAYGGDADYASVTSGAVVVSVSGTLTPTVSVTPSSLNITTAQALTVYVAVSSGPGTPTPTGSVTLASSNYSSAPATLTGGSAALNIPAGSLALGIDSLLVSYTADSSGSLIYADASNAVSVTVIATAPTITFSVPNHVYGDDPFTVSAASNSSGAIIYSVVSGPATISGSTVTLTGVGTVVLQASQVAAGDYASGAQTATFIVAGQAPTITFTVPNHTYGDAPFTVSATSNSSGVITYSVVSGPATISGSTVTLTGVGTVVLQASQAAAGNYASGAQTTTFTVAGIPPTITFTVPNHTYGDAPFTVSATSNSSGAISYAVVSGPATIAGSTVTLTGAGTVVLQASQVAAGNYVSGAQTATFIVAGQAPTITFTVPNHTYGDVPFAVSATSNSSGAISYSVVSGPATISNSTVTLTGAGTVVLQASEVAAGGYGSGAQTTTFAVAKDSQTITFTAPISPVNYGASSVTLAASASSGLAVVFSVLSGPASVSGNTLTITGAGTVVVAADQSGDTNYSAATEVTHSITVNKATPAVGLAASPNPILVQNTVTLTATVSSSVSMPTGSVTFSDSGTTLGATNLSGGIATLTISTLSVGSHSIATVYGGDGNFNSVSSTAVAENVEDFTLTIGGSGSSQTVQPGGTATYTLPLSPSGGTTFPSVVTLSATGLPSGFTATFNPTSLAAGSPATTVALTIQAPLTAMLEKGRQPGWGLPLVALGMLVLPFLGGLARSRKRLQQLALLALFLTGLGGVDALSGCGGGGSGNSGGGSGSQPRVYTVTVTAASGSLSHSTTLTLTVQ
jgi:Big-like domain-containing protein/VCBS repeat protein